MPAVFTSSLWEGM